MRKSVYVLLGLLLIFSCKSAEKLLQEGNYDEAIDKSIKKIQRGNAKDDDKQVLDKAYKMANERDLKRVDFLLEENRPENWEEIYWRYSDLDIRQEKVQTVMPMTLKSKKINYPRVDYNSRIIEAKINAAAHFYTEGLALMKGNTKEAFREAYFNFNKVNEYRPSDYPELKGLLDEAAFLGMSRVLLEVDNHLPVRLPPQFFHEVGNVNTHILDGNWVEYHLAPSNKIQYDYYVVIMLNHVQVDPPVTESKEYVRTKKIQDGERDKKDSEGNVIKDSNGKPVKEPVYKNIECKVYEIRQTKAATVSGEIQILSAQPERLIRKIPLAGTSIFETRSGRAVGDRNALTEEDLALIKRGKEEFPPDIDLIMDCAPVLRDAATDAIRNNRNAIY
ncbi:MAG: hypothetical protein JW801_09035 [Bacteroidales bacterium]|nr:hypothetical protein [Bacteroidales bacterium]